MSTSWRIFTFFNPYAPWDPRSWKVTKSVDTRKGGYTCLYIPTEVLMNEFNGRLTDSGQVVTDQIIPFSKIKGGWIQNSKAAWDRLIVKSGDEQVVRIGRVQSSIVATKEFLLRLAKQCMSVEEQPFDELTMDAMTLIDKFENHLIPEGGKRTIRRAHQARGLYTRKETGHRIRVPVLSSLSQGDANCLCHLFGMLDSPRESWLEAIQDHRGRGRRGNHKAAT